MNIYIYIYIYIYIQIVIVPVGRGKPDSDAVRAPDPLYPSLYMHVYMYLDK